MPQSDPDCWTRDSNCQRTKVSRHFLSLGGQFLIKSEERKGKVTADERGLTQIKGARNEERGMRKRATDETGQKTESLVLMLCVGTTGKRRVPTLHATKRQRRFTTQPRAASECELLWIRVSVPRSFWPSNEEVKQSARRRGPIIRGRFRPRMNTDCCKPSCSAINPWCR